MVTFGSLNTRGLAEDRIFYISDVLRQHVDILMIQEHWQFDGELQRTLSTVPDVQVYGKSGMNSEVLHQGRPFGGCAILVKNALACTVDVVPTVNPRLFSCIIKLESGISFLLHCVYMPTDTSHDLLNLSVFNEVLYDVDAINCLHDDVHNIIIGGDLNTDIQRVDSLHSQALQNFCQSHSLTLSQNLTCSTVDFSYVNVSGDAVSLIDHFITSENLVPRITKYECLHDGHNLSDHHPLLLRTDLSVSTGSGCCAPRSYQEKPKWDRAEATHIGHYKAELRRELQSIDPPMEALSCRTTNCSAHLRDIDDYYERLMNACITAADSAVPSGPTRRRAGWSEHVKPFQDDAKFWHQVWTDCGRPTNGTVKELMLKTRGLYKRKSKWLIRNQDKASAERMAEALSENHSRDLWSEVKRKSKSSNTASAFIDNASGNEDICQVFAEKYESLYQSVSFNPADMDLLKKSSFCPV